MRILIFNWRDIAHPQSGGAEVYTHEVAKQWVAQGHDVTLFCSGHKSLPSTAIIDGVRVIRRGSRYSVYWHATRFYKREAVNNFDLILDESNTRPFHVHRYASDGVPIVTLVHQLAREIWFHEFPWPAAMFGRYVLEPYWVWKCRGAKVVAVSESTATSLRHHGLSDVSIVAEGMSLPEYAVERPKEQAPTVVFCGRLASNKRPDHAVQAFREIRRAVPEARMWVVGSGPMEEALRAAAPDGVEFHGRVSDERKFELMARAHVLVATSVREGWGLVVSEAAAVGTTSVGYDVPGLRDSIPASNGILTPANTGDLAAAVVATLAKVRSGVMDKPVPGGLASWSEVADSILVAAGGASAPQDLIDLR